LIDKVINEVYWFVSWICRYCPASFREDLMQDIYMQLVMDLSEQNGDLSYDEKVTYCLNKTRNYKTKFMKQYINNQCVDIHEYEETLASNDPISGYSLRFDIDFVWQHLTIKQKKLLRFLMENGVDVPNSEVMEHLGYKAESSAMWAKRLLLQKLARLLEGETTGKYNDDKRYSVYKTK